MRVGWGEIGERVNEADSEIYAFAHYEDAYFNWEARPQLFGDL